MIFFPNMSIYLYQNLQRRSVEFWNRINVKLSRLFPPV